MHTHRRLLHAAAVGLWLVAVGPALAQRGGMRGGGFNPGGMRGGGFNPGGMRGGGFNPGGMTRPSMPVNRPAAMHRPSPGGGNFANRPGAGGGLPNWSGGGGLPNRPGGLPNRPGGLPNRPGGGGMLPSRPGWIAGNQPTFNNRPSLNNRPNIGQIGGNIGAINRPVNNSINNNININRINNINNTNRFTNVNTNVFRGGNNYNYNVNRGGWGGGWGGWGSGWNRPGWGWGSGVGRVGWTSPYYGNWYQGGWGGNGFWTGFGAGALTSFGLGALTSGYGYGWGYPGYGYSSMGLYNYFPTWGVANYSSWGLGGLANSVVYSNYVNPYNAVVVAAQPAAAVAYDYSQPIDVAAPAPAAEVAETTGQTFDLARAAFKSGDYQQALDLTDAVLKKTPNVPVIHEFRALALFALGRYDEASAADYAVLSTGPGWNWATLVGLYPDVDSYTVQLRALESVARTQSNSASPQFLLGYHYMVQGHKEAAAAQFEKVAKLAPDDRLAASFVKVLKKAAEPAPAVAQTTPAPTTAPARPVEPAETRQAPSPTATEEKPADEPPPPPPANLVGSWKSQPSADVAIALTLEKDGAFSWEVDSKGHKETITGHAGYKDETLALFQTDGPPLAGKVSQTGPDAFVFNPAGAGAKSPGLTFTR